MKIQKTIMKLLLLQPFYGNIAASLAVVENNKIPEMKTIYFPTPTLNYHGEWFNQLEDELAQWVIIHELLHLSLLHPFRRDNRDGLLWELSCDLAVNEFIPTQFLTEKCATVEIISAKAGVKLEPRKSAEYYYHQLIKLEDGIALFDNGEQIGVKVGGNQELVVNKQSYELNEANQVNIDAIKEKLNHLINYSLEEGKIPEGLSEQYNEIYRENSVDWRNIFKRFLIGRGRIESRRSYKKESRRYSGFPGNKRSIGLKCLLAIDESGSVSNRQVEEFYNEIIGINKITNAEIYVTRFDTACSQPVLITKSNLIEKRVKNGGTDFRPVFELADKMKMELLVIFTDGDGVAPEYVNQRVLWVMTKGGRCPVQYGFSVELK